MEQLFDINDDKNLVGLDQWFGLGVEGAQGAIDKLTHEEAEALLERLVYLQKKLETKGPGCDEVIEPLLIAFQFDNLGEALATVDLPIHLLRFKLNP